MAGGVYGFAARRSRGWGYSGGVVFRSLAAFKQNVQELNEVTYDMSACNKAHVSLSIFNASSSFGETLPSMTSSCSSSSLLVSGYNAPYKTMCERTAECISGGVWVRSHSRDGGGFPDCPCWPDIQKAPRRTTRIEYQPSLSAVIVVACAYDNESGWL